MHAFINSSLKIGSLTIPHRLIQGPLAGYSCAPFRTLFDNYRSPAYCVTEMSSAMDILYKHSKILAIFIELQKNRFSLIRLQVQNHIFWRKQHKNYNVMVLILLT